MDHRHKPLLDRIGIGASIACAIHCIALPFLFATLPLFGIELMRNRKIDVCMILVSFFAGSWALYHGYKKHHHYLWPLIVFSAGLSLIIVGTFTGIEWFEMALKFLGAGAIVTAHIYNLRYGRQCTIHPLVKTLEVKEMYTDLKTMEVN